MPKKIKDYKPIYSFLKDVHAFEFNGELNDAKERLLHGKDNEK